MCQTTLYLQFSECEDSHLFDITLDPLTKYYYSIVDKFGNKYNGEVVTDLSGYFSLNNSDFLPYLFNKNAGNFTLTLKENSASCDYLNIVKCGNIYGNIVFSFISKNEVLVPNFISSYTAGTSTISFTNNGGDDWDIGFKISMDSEQLPSGQTIDDYDIDVYHYVSGVGTQIEQSNRSTDHVVNTSGNGAGVYSVEQAYNVYDNGNYVTSITQQSLYKVDALGNLEAYFKGKGIIVNSVNGLDINVSAVVEQSENYPIEWYSLDGNNAPQLIGTGETVTLTLPSNCIFIIAQAVIDSVFTNDCPQSPYNLSSIIIN